MAGQGDRVTPIRRSMWAMRHKVVRVTAVIAVVASASMTHAICAQSSAEPAAGTSVRQAMPDSVATVPFKSGEVAEYNVKFGVISAGAASMRVVGAETLRDRSVWHIAFKLSGGIPFFHVDDLLESWMDRATLSSLRFTQRQKEGPKSRTKLYEIYPDRAIYVEMDKKPPREHPGVKDPLDDASFLYFIRTVSLTVGQTYSSDRYFRPDRNPVRIRVLRKETIEVPAGKFNCIVIQPVIKTDGIFSENGQAEVWLSDDDRHVVVQLKSKMSFGSINMYLKSYKPGQ